MHGGCSSTYELMPAADASPNSCHSQLRICRIVSRLCRPFRGSACMPNTCGTAALSVAACLYRTRRHQLQPACGFAPAAVLGFDASRALVNTPAPTELRRICCFPPTGYCCTNRLATTWVYYAYMYSRWCTHMQLPVCYWAAARSARGSCSSGSSARRALAGLVAAPQHGCVLPHPECVWTSAVWMIASSY